MDMRDLLGELAAAVTRVTLFFAARLLAVRLPKFLDALVLAMYALLPYRLHCLGRLCSGCCQPIVLRQCTLSAALRAFRWSQTHRPVAALGQRSNNISDALCRLLTAT